MPVMEVYSDASENGDYLSVGSLLFRKKNIRSFEKKWRSMLREFDIEYFHMTDCNSQRGPYSQMSHDECDRCARMAISIILEFAASGTIFSIKKQDFYDIITERGIMPNPFTLGVWFTLHDIRHWGDENDPTARISYIFEAGDKHQPDANMLFAAISADAERRNRFRYKSHAFLPKRISLPTQAADILAWHGAKHAHRRNQGNFRLRGDFDAIISKLRVTDGYHDPKVLRGLIEVAERHAGKFGNEIAGVAFRYTDSNSSQMNLRLAEILSRGD